MSVLLNYDKIDGVLDYHYLKLDFYDYNSPSGSVEQILQRLSEIPPLAIAVLGIGGIVLMAIVGYKVMNYTSKADRLELPESENTE